MIGSNDDALVGDPQLELYVPRALLFFTAFVPALFGTSFSFVRPRLTLAGAVAQNVCTFCLTTGEVFTPLADVLIRGGYNLT